MVRIYLFILKERFKESEFHYLWPRSLINLMWHIKLNLLGILTPELYFLIRRCMILNYVLSLLRDLTPEY